MVMSVNSSGVLLASLLILAPAVWSDQSGKEPSGQQTSNSVFQSEITRDTGESAKRSSAESFDSTLQRLIPVARAQAADEPSESTIEKADSQAATAGDSLLMWVIGTLLMSLLVLPRDRKRIAN